MGAAVTLFSSIFFLAVPVVGLLTPFAPLLGGGVSGWLWGKNKTDSARLGALSGAIASIVFTPFLLLAFAFAVFDSGAGFFLLLLLTMIGSGYLIGLSALGGAVGFALNDSEATQPEPDQDTTTSSYDKYDTIEVLQQRYVAGELTEEAYERKVEQVMETNRSENEIAGTEYTVNKK